MIPQPMADALRYGFERQAGAGIDTEQQRFHVDLLEVFVGRPSASWPGGAAIVVNVKHAAWREARVGANQKVKVVGYFAWG